MTSGCTGARASVDPLNEWDSLESMLLSEFDRLSEHFDEQGRERDPDRPTIPSRRAERALGVDTEAPPP
jgi:hypothetical protein